MRNSLLSIAVLSIFATPILSYAEDTANAKADNNSATVEEKAQAVVLNGPGMNFPLTLNADPIHFDAGPIGKVYVSGAVSALGLLQSNPTAPFLDFFHSQRILHARLVNFPYLLNKRCNLSAT